MSKEVLRTALEGILNPGAHVTQAARTMGSIGLGLTIVWGIVVSVLRWMAPHIEWAAAYTGWTSLLMKGSVAIMIVCVAAFAIGLILRPESAGTNGRKATLGLPVSDYLLERRRERLVT